MLIAGTSDGCAILVHEPEASGEFGAELSRNFAANARALNLPTNTMIERFPLTVDDIDQLRRGVADLEPHLTQDGSNYAPGRRRAWIQMEWCLKERDFVPAVAVDADFWGRCCQLCQGTAGFTPDLGLVAKGEKGIFLHRDDSYAAFKAVSIQLGKAEWTYDCQYPGYMWVPQEQLLPSDPQTVVVENAIIVFNCKNRHGATPLEADRWSINLWQVSSRFQAAFRQAQLQAQQ